MISVIIPVYNSENSIGKCIDSVLLQTCEDFEIIIVNDCSSDNSEDIARSYANKTDKIHIISNPENMGSMLSRCNGYSYAKGEYCLFVDSDDTLPDNALELLRLACTDTKSDVTIGNIRYINKDGDTTVSHYILKDGTSKTEIYKSLLQNEISHSLCGKLFRTDLLTKYHYQSERGATNGEDAFLFYQLVENIHKMSLIDDVVYNYHQNTQSSTNTPFSENKINSIYHVLKLQYALSKKYSEIEQLFINRITQSICNFYTHPIKLSVIRKCQKNNSFSGFVTSKNMIKAYGLRGAAKELIKIFITTPLKRLWLNS